MAITIPHNSQAGIAVAGGGRAANYVGSSTFMTPGQSAMPEALGRLAQGMDKLGGAIHEVSIEKRKEQLEKQKEQTELEILETVQNATMEAQKRDDDYRAQNQGKNAVNAEKDAVAFYDELNTRTMEPWQNNPQAMLYLQRHLGSMAASSIGTMRDYATTQQKAWKDSGMEKDRQIFLTTAADWRKSPEEIREAFQPFASRQAEYYISKGLDPTAAQLQVEGIYQEAINTNVYNRLMRDADGGNPSEALRVLDGKPRSVNLPGNVADMAQGIATSSGVSPELVKAVISAESDGRADAVSPKGARGLMQLMPDTQKELEQQLGIDGSTPEGNIKLGTAYLKELLGRYDGDERLALMAYNWGMGNVDAFIKTGNGKDDQTVPLETRQYVNKITGGEETLAQQVLTPEQKFKIRTTAEVRSADSLSEDLYQRITSGEMTEAQAREQITGIENEQVRRATRQGFTERLQIFKAQEREDILVAGERAYDDMASLSSSKDKSEAAILKDMYKLCLDAEIQARIGTGADKAYSRSVNQMYATAISGLGITNRSDPAVFIEAQNAIMYGKVTSSRDLKATYPTLAFRDMERLDGVLKASQQVDLMEVNRLFDVYAGLNPDTPVDSEEKAEYKAMRMTLLQNVIDSAKETNRGNDTEWIKAKVAQFFIAGTDRGKIYDTDMTAGKAIVKEKTFYPEITEEERARINADFDADPKLKEEYLKKHGSLNYAIRARYWKELQEGLGAREPERPDDVPDDAKWDKTRMGWLGTNPQTGRPGFRPLIVTR